MKLFCFSHLKEAHAWIQHEKYYPVKGGDWFDRPDVDKKVLQGLYFNQTDLVCITGEGVFAAQNKVASILGWLSDKIDHIYNFGVAGALDDEILKHQIYCVRSIYLENPLALEFTSYQIDLKEKDEIFGQHAIDLVTSFQRVQSLEQRQKLRPLARLVDREAWGIASACQLWGKSYCVFKVVSDFADQSLCEVVQGEANKYSNLLYQYYKDVINKETFLKNNHNQSQNDFIFDTIDGLLLDHKDLHMTFSQQKHYRNLLFKIKNQKQSEDDLLKLINADEIIRNKDMSPKSKTKKILELLHLEVHPVQKQMMLRLQNIFQNFEQNQINWSSPADFEDQHLKIDFIVQNKKQWDYVLKTLNEFDYQKYIQFIEGE